MSGTSTTSRNGSRFKRLDEPLNDRALGRTPPDVPSSEYEQAIEQLRIERVREQLNLAAWRGIGLGLGAGLLLGVVAGLLINLSL